MMTFCVKFIAAFGANVGVSFGMTADSGKYDEKNVHNHATVTDRAQWASSFSSLLRLINF